MYIRGKRFQVRTDHQALPWLKNFREPEGQLARWQETLADFDFDVLYRPGTQHVNADAMSRIPMREPHECMLHVILEDNFKGIFASNMQLTVGPVELFVGST